MEQDGTATAAVNGTYVARKTSDSGTVDSIDISGKSVTLNDNTANYFKVGDYITLSGTSGDKKVTKVSRDGVTLTLNSAPQSDNTGSVVLQNSETIGLISDKTTSASGVTDLSTTALPY